MKNIFHNFQYSLKKHIIIYSAFTVISIAVVIIITHYIVSDRLFRENTNLKTKVTYSLYIRSNDTYQNILDKLKQDSVLLDYESFSKLALRKHYDEHIRPGRFLISEGMTNEEIIRILLKGEQTPVKVVFSNIRDVEELAQLVSTQIEADSASIVNAYNNQAFIDSLGYTPENKFIMIIPNTYEFYWNTTAENFWRRLKHESNKFWNESRTNQAKTINMSKENIYVLASIVEKETQNKNERSRIAGVYVNRLNRGVCLQADPTLVFISNYDGMRVKNSFKDIDSPYNTYKYKGLPPGPIWIPSINSIDAVLNYEHHNYLFFCARADFSGYHDFAETYSQHRHNAANFQRALNEKNIQ